MGFYARLMVCSRILSNVFKEAHKCFPRAELLHSNSLSDVGSWWRCLALCNFLHLISKCSTDSCMSHSAKFYGSSLEIVCAWEIFVCPVLSLERTLRFCLYRRSVQQSSDPLIFCMCPVEPLQWWVKWISSFSLMFLIKSAAGVVFTPTFCEDLPIAVRVSTCLFPRMLLWPGT